MIKPPYADWYDLPFRIYLEGQKLLQKHYKPEDGLTVTAEIELIQLLYGLSEADLDTIPASDVKPMYRAIAPFILGKPPVDDTLEEFNWFGTTYVFDRQPQHITMRQLKTLEEIRITFPDKYDVSLMQCAMLVAPKAESLYGQEGEAKAFRVDRIHQWQIVGEWPTTVCLSLLAFFLKHWNYSNPDSQPSTDQNNPETTLVA